MSRLRGVTGPLCLWLILICAVGLLVARGQAQERDQLVDRFQSRAVNGANVIGVRVGVRVDDVFTAERRQIREMSRSDWTSADVAANADLFGFGSALLLDGEGRVMATVPADPDLLGTEVASKYPHLSDTLAGKPTVSAGDPAMAQMMLAQPRRSPDHPIVAGERVVAAEPVQGTEWTYVLDVPRAALLAPAASNDLGQ